MIKELTIECEEISRVETNHVLGNNVKVTISKPNMAFLEEVDAKSIICGLDPGDMMKAIVEIYGIEFIRDWHDELGK